MGVIRRALWHSLGAASGHSQDTSTNTHAPRLATDCPPDAHPNVHIWCVVWSHAKQQKTHSKNVLACLGGLSACSMLRSLCLPSGWETEQFKHTRTLCKQPSILWTAGTHCSTLKGWGIRKRGSIVARVVSFCPFRIEAFSCHLIPPYESPHSLLAVSSLRALLHWSAYPTCSIQGSGRPTKGYFPFI